MSPFLEFWDTQKNILIMLKLENSKTDVCRTNDANILKRLFGKTMMAIAICSTFIISSCNMYDEEDATIIAFLRINDLIEEKLNPVCFDEINKMNSEVNEYNKRLASASFGAFFGINTGSYGNYDLPYDIDVMNTFNEKYKIIGNGYDLALLEQDVTSELWAYLNLTYSDIIPAKAQNAQEGRYYTIKELKDKYPDYKEVELEDFSPMELLNTVTNEKLFELSMLSDGDVNLRTLYIFYLAYKQIPEPALNEIDSSIDYMSVIRQHLDEESIKQLDLNEVIATFNRVSLGTGSYDHNMAGFERFAMDYFQTDIFSGADIEEY